MERLFQWQQKVAYCVLCVWYDNSVVHPKATILSCVPFVKYVGSMRILYIKIGVHHPSYHYLEDHYAIIFNLEF